ncbi:methionine synthase [Nocardioides sp.]|uniref:methionine synthase n=1 Tax=Nocardioides sp. TaxID=35761 RepID=UPI0039E674BA
MTVATGVGSLPGTDYAEAVKLVLGELPDLPHVPELPARGAIASMVGRTLALLPLDADLQPAGWRLTGSAGSPAIDQRRARSLLAQDLDVVEETADGYGGVFKLQVTGPFTLAATVERPRGDKLLADHGARRELAQALAEGLSDHVKDVRRRVAATRLIVQLDEPALSAVLAGRVPTASGYGRHRSVDLPEASDLLRTVIDAVDGEVWVHSCAPDTPLGLLRGAGATGLSVDLAMLKAKDHDDLAEALEAGASVALGVVPTLEPARRETDKEVTERVLRWFDLLGLDPERAGEQLVLTPACGLAGTSGGYAKAALALVRTSAASLG